MEGGEKNDSAVCHALQAGTGFLGVCSHVQCNGPIVSFKFRSAWILRMDLFKNSVSAVALG